MADLSPADGADTARDDLIIDWLRSEQVDPEPTPLGFLEKPCASSLSPYDIARKQFGLDGSSAERTAWSAQSVTRRRVPTPKISSQLASVMAVKGS
jgi:hypothetical protein